MPTKPKYRAGDTATAIRSNTTLNNRIAGKNVVIIGNLGKGFYKVRTPRGTKVYTLRAGVDL
jgi:hypothetical protein